MSYPEGDAGGVIDRVKLGDVEFAVVHPCEECFPLFWIKEELGTVGVFRVADRNAAIDECKLDTVISSAAASTLSPYGPRWT